MNQHEAAFICQAAEIRYAGEAEQVFRYADLIITAFPRRDWLAAEVWNALELARMMREWDTRS